MSPSIVCGFDGSPPAWAAARLGSALAHLLGVELVLVHALSASRPRAEAVSFLTTIQRELYPCEVRVHVRRGPASLVLAVTASDHDLLVVGRAACSVGRAALGRSVRASLARRAPCPLIAVPAVPRLGGGEVLCGVRDWADVQTARVTARFARAANLSLTLMHVLPVAAGRGSAPASPSGVIERPWDRDTAYQLLTNVSRLIGAEASLRVNRGTAGRALAMGSVTSDAAFVVVGAPSRGALPAAVSG